MWDFKKNKIEIMNIPFKNAWEVYLLRYFHFLYKKMKKYDKKAVNPFCNKNTSIPITKATYIWVEKPENSF